MVVVVWSMYRVDGGGLCLHCTSCMYYDWGWMGASLSLHVQCECIGGYMAISPHMIVCLCRWMGEIGVRTMW